MISAESILDHLESVLRSSLPAYVAVQRALTPTIDLPDIVGWYQEEHDFGQVQESPAVILFEQEPRIVQSSGFYLFTLPVDVVFWHICPVYGLETMHRQLKRYRAAAVAALLEQHVSEPGYWRGLALGKYLGTPILTDEDSSYYGRAKGVQVEISAEEDY